MKASQEMKKEYDKVVCFNKYPTFYHTMNIERYKISYRDFFDDTDNVLFEQDIAESNLDSASEDIYVDWLNEEWNG